MELVRISLITDFPADALAEKGSEAGEFKTGTSIFIGYHTLSFFFFWNTSGNIEYEKRFSASSA